jgi:hypothetical protein
MNKSEARCVVKDADLASWNLNISTRSEMLNEWLSVRGLRRRYSLERCTLRAHRDDGTST